jgi:hypothetical protein
MQLLPSQQQAVQLQRRSNDGGTLHRIRSQQRPSIIRRSSRANVATVKAGRKAAASTAASAAASSISQLPAALPPLIAYSVMAGAGYTAIIFAAVSDGMLSVLGEISRISATFDQESWLPAFTDDPGTTSPGCPGHDEASLGVCSFGTYIHGLVGMLVGPRHHFLASTWQHLRWNERWRASLLCMPVMLTTATIVSGATRAKHVSAYPSIHTMQQSLCNYLSLSAQCLCNTCRWFQPPVLSQA